MALKRKASFTTITSPSGHSYYNHSPSPCSSPVPMPFLGTATITVDEPPRHLHSRTRKRFRNDRPDEQSIYDKTLQWLFSAQRKQSSAAQSGHTNNLDNIISPPAAEIPQQSSIDPNQQTLQRFFQPVRASSHCPIQSHCSSKKVMHPPTQPLAGNGVSISHSSSGGSGSSTSASAEGTGVHTTGTRYIDMDIDMDVDMDVGCYAGIEGFVPVAVSMASTQGQWEYEEGKRWVGGIGWM
ncbi:hypothetical protein ACJ72_05806 [Emergomyces africanus]|uniref:Uncharacterized protein n=1 Tax=Emergomyces africanus TaxID=1955775 RepID=A0A1B7NSW7_9EURO|nr:hypothetical protein ACJ72_05806 [Emergomyces africanus]